MRSQLPHVDNLLFCMLHTEVLEALECILDCRVGLRELVVESYSRSSCLDHRLGSLNGTWLGLPLPEVEVEALHHVLEHRLAVDLLLKAGRVESHRWPHLEDGERFRLLILRVFKQLHPVIDSKEADVPVVVAVGFDPL